MQAKHDAVLRSCEAILIECMIKQVMRQGEDKFVRLLNELRWGKVSAASTAALLECQRKHKQPLAPSDGVEMTKLYPYNINVRAENEKHLESLAGELVTFKAEDSIKRVGSGKRLEALGVEQSLQLKVGAQVVPSTHNLCPQS